MRKSIFILSLLLSAMVTGCDYGTTDSDNPESGTGYRSPEGKQVKSVEMSFTGEDADRILMQFSYDDTGRVSQISMGEKGNINLQYPSGKIILDIEFEGANLLHTEVSMDESGKAISAWSYEDNDESTAITQTYSYNTSGQLIYIDDWETGYDWKNGNRISDTYGDTFLYSDYEIKSNLDLNWIAGNFMETYPVSVLGAIRAMGASHRNYVYPAPFLSSIFISGVLEDHIDIPLCEDYLDKLYYKSYYTLEYDYEESLADFTVDSDGALAEVSSVLPQYRKDYKAEGKPVVMDWNDYNVGDDKKKYYNYISNSVR